MAQLNDIKPEGVKDGRYKNNHENDTCIKDWYCLTDYRLKRRCIKVFLYVKNHLLNSILIIWPLWEFESLI